MATRDATTAVKVMGVTSSDVLTSIHPAGIACCCLLTPRGADQRDDPGCGCGGGGGGCGGGGGGTGGEPAEGDAGGRRSARHRPWSHGLLLWRPLVTASLQRDDSVTRYSALAQEQSRPKETQVGDAAHAMNLVPRSPLQ
jgi:hypothetical protein